MPQLLYVERVKMTTIKTKLIKLSIFVAFVILCVCLGLAFMTVSNKAYAEADSHVPSGLADDPVDFYGVKLSHPDGLTAEDYSISDESLSINKLGFTLDGEVSEAYRVTPKEVFVTSERPSSSNDITFNGKLNIDKGIMFFNVTGEDLKFNINADVVVSNIDVMQELTKDTNITFTGNGSLTCAPNQYTEGSTIQYYLNFHNEGDTVQNLIFDGPSVTIKNAAQETPEYGINAHGNIAINKGNFYISTVPIKEGDQSITPIHAGKVLTVSPNYNGELFFSSHSNGPAIYTDTGIVQGLDMQGTVGIHKKLELNNWYGKDNVWEGGLSMQEYSTDKYWLMMSDGVTPCVTYYNHAKNWVEPEPTPTPSEETNAAQTGDSAPLVPFVLLAVLAGGVFLYTRKASQK